MINNFSNSHLFTTKENTVNYTKKESNIAIFSKFAENLKQLKNNLSNLMRELSKLLLMNSLYSIN